MRSALYRVAITKLVSARKAAGLTQRDLAVKLEKPPSFIAKIENGERRLDLIEFIAIARALGLAERDLLRPITGALPKKIDLTG